MVESNARGETWKHYIADGLLAIAENTSRYLGWNGAFVESGRTMTERWAASIKEQDNKSEKDEPCKDVVQGIWRRIKGAKK